MLIGFIAVVVVLLIIVGIMSSTTSTGSGGVDQTRATKAMAELSGLVQNISFIKTTNEGNYPTDTSVAALLTEGVISADAVETIDVTAVGADYSVLQADPADAGAVVAINAFDVEIAGAGADGADFAADTALELIKSASIPGLYFLTSTENNSLVVRTVIENGTVSTELAKALDTSLGKVVAASADLKEGAVTTDALQRLSFK